MGVSLGKASIAIAIWPLEYCQKNTINKKLRSRPGKPNQRKGQNEKFMNFAHFCEFWCFSLGKQARFTLNFCSGTPLRKVHELAFLWFGLPGPLLKNTYRSFSALFTCFLLFSIVFERFLLVFALGLSVSDLFLDVHFRTFSRHPLVAM